jgi:hypothetical protein
VLVATLKKPKKKLGKKIASPTFQINDELSTLCEELQELTRFREMNLRTRIMMINRLEGIVRVYYGYNTHLPKKERKVIEKKTIKVLKSIREGKKHKLSGLVASTDVGANGFDRVVKNVDKQIAELAQKLPVAKWKEEKNQRGFGMKSLGIVIGSTGDLRKYDNPCKVWKRMGLAPITYKGETKMPFTWKVNKKKLPAEIWTKFGDSPRRRSVMFNIANCLVKLNHGTYRERYNEVKIEAAEKHPDWTSLHIDKHARLLMNKFLLKELWKQWNPNLFTTKEKK